MRGTVKIDHIDGINVFVEPATFEIGSPAFYVNTTFRIRVYCPADVFFVYKYI